MYAAARFEMDYIMVTFCVGKILCALLITPTIADAQTFLQK